MLDEDLSQAQLAQLEEFLDLDVDFVLSGAENGHTHTIISLHCHSDVKNEKKRRHE